MRLPSLRRKGLEKLKTAPTPAVASTAPQQEPVKPSFDTLESHALQDVGAEYLIGQEVSLGEGSPDLQHSHGECSLQGQRKYMEDRVITHDLSGNEHFNGCCSRAVLLGVFDGHNGMEAAEYLRTSFLGHFLTSENLGTQQWGAALRRTLLVDNKLHLANPVPPHRPQPLTHLSIPDQPQPQPLPSFQVDNKLHLANVGDCRAVVSDDGEGRALTRDHKPPCNPMEKERVELAGWCISIHLKIIRLTSNQCFLATSLGPLEKERVELAGLMMVEDSAAVIIAEPDLFLYSVHQDSEFLILASDGVWDTVSNTEAVRQVRRRLVAGASPELAATVLVKYALTMGSGDNVAAVVLRLSSRTLSQSSSTRNSVLGRTMLAIPSATLPPIQQINSSTNSASITVESHLPLAAIPTPSTMEILPSAALPPSQMIDYFVSKAAPIAETATPCAANTTPINVTAIPIDQRADLPTSKAEPFAETATPCAANTTPSNVTAIPVDQCVDPPAAASNPSAATAMTSAALTLAQCVERPAIATTHVHVVITVATADDSTTPSVALTLAQCVERPSAATSSVHVVITVATAAESTAPGAALTLAQCVERPVVATTPVSVVITATTAADSTMPSATLPPTKRQLLTKPALPPPVGPPAFSRPFQKATFALRAPTVNRQSPQLAPMAQCAHADWTLSPPDWMLALQSREHASSSWPTHPAMQVLPTCVVRSTKQVPQTWSDQCGQHTHVWVGHLASALTCGWRNLACQLKEGSGS
eukprot:gene29577-5931_t